MIILLNDLLATTSRSYGLFAFPFFCSFRICSWSADLGIQVLGDGRLLVSGQVEISGVRESTRAGGTSAKAPMIGTFQQVLKVVLQAGKKLRVAEGPDPEAGTLYLDLQADLVE